MTPELAIPKGAQLTRAELSQLIADHYGVDPYARRSEVLGESQYVSDGGRFCAIALLVRPTSRRLLIEDEDATTVLLKIPTAAFIDGIQHLDLKSLEYWNELQELHDNSKHWTSVGLSETGERYLRYLKRHYP